MITINLIVLRVGNLKKSVEFYQSLGFNFIEEKHGNGPIHYAADINGLVLELYSASLAYPVENSTRLGFNISNMDNVINRLEIEKLIDDETVIISDPDGRKIHLIVNKN